MQHLHLCRSFAGVVFFAFALSGCEGEVAATRCNSEVDCALSERCVDGLCVEGDPGTTPEVAEPDTGGPDTVEPEADAGARDGGEPDANEPDAGEPDISPSDGGPGQLDGGVSAADGGEDPADAGPVVDGGGVPDGWWDLRWRARRTGTINLPAGNGRGALTFPVVIPSAFAEDPTLRIVVDGESRPFDLSEGVAWVAMPAIGDAESLSIDLYREGPTTVPPPHPAAAWPNALGVWHLGADLLDRSGKELHGTGSPVEVVDGVVGTARGFRSVNNPDAAIHLPGDIDIIGGNAGFTIAAWQRVSVNAAGPYHDIISISGHEGGEQSNALLATNAAGGYRLRARGAFGDEGLLTLNTPPPLSAPEGQWAFVVGVVDFEAQEMAIYLDGTRLAAQPIPTFGANANGPALFAKESLREVAKNSAIGAEDDGLLISDSDVDEVRLLGAALSAEDIVLLHSAEVGGGLSPTFAEVVRQSENAPQPSPGAVPEADTVTVLPGESVVVDVRLNDPEALRSGTIASVVPSSASGVDVRVLQDGRLEIVADSDAPLGATAFTVSVSDGLRPPKAANLDVEVAERNRPRCAHITSRQVPGDQVVLTSDEVATRGRPVSVSAAFGTASIEGDNVLYSAPPSGPATPVADGLSIEIENDGIRCTAAVTFDLRAVGSLDAPDRQEDVDRWVDRYFRVPQPEGIEVVIDPVFIAIDAPVTHDGPKGLVHQSTRTGTAFARYHYLDEDGREGRSAKVEFHTAHGVDGATFGQRIRVVLDDTDPLFNDVDTVSGLVDLRGTPAAEASDVHFYAPGSRKVLAATPEGSLDGAPVRYRVRFPLVYEDTTLNYFWVYFDMANPSPAPDVGVWADDIVGAWGLSQSLEDQSGNGNDAVGPGPDGLEGIRFAGAASSVGVPSLDFVHLLYPVTIEVVFEPNTPWTSNSPSSALVTRFNGGSDGNYHLVWANPQDYNLPVATLLGPSFVSKDDPSTPNSNFHATYPASIVDDDVNVLVHVMEEPAFSTLFLNGTAKESGTANNGTPLDGLVFDGTWTFGPGDIDTSNVPGGRLDTHASIRSVRIWNRELSRDHIFLTTSSERGSLLSFEAAEAAP